MTDKKVVFGFAGLMASGKDTAADYLKNRHHASTYSFSTMLSDLLNRLYLESNRDYLIKMSECIRETFGEDIMAKTMARDVADDSHDLVVISNNRRLADIEYLSKMPNFVLVEIFADPRVRYERLVQRGQKTDDHTKTFEQFVEDHKRSTEMSILDVTAQATEHIDNNGTREELYAQLDALVEKYCD